ncbi:MAG TPA: glycosyltransferase, partial [Pyrinomonadaceae bacterium]|nr:glycosyltransferase [Pyrinomonadaceae bacterium]
MTEPIRTVHLTNYYHKSSGGISTSYNNLLAAAEGHQRYVSLIVPGEHEEVEIINDFAKIYFVAARYSPIFDKRYRVMMPWQYMLKGSAIRKILLAEQPDLIEVTDKYMLSLIGPMIRTNNFKRLGRPILVHFSCERMDDNIASFLIRGRAGKWIARRAMGNYNLPSFDYHIANSTYTADEFYEAASSEKNPRRSKWFLNMCWRFFRAPRVPLDERVFICPRGVNAEFFSPRRHSEDVKRELRERAGIPDDSITLLYAGRISPEKNIPLLADIMKILASDETHDYRLVVAGGGPKADWLREEGRKSANGKIVLLGHLDKETLADYYANVDVFVHPNPHEPFGIAPLEAMASGTPTVAPNAGGVLSYATNENAWLVEPTGENFAAAVREIVDDPILRARKVNCAVATARKSTREASTERLFETY